MRRRTTAMLLCLLPAAACALASPALAQVVPSTTPSAQNPATQELKYKGVAQIPGIALDFTVSFQPFEDGDGWVASLTIPMQGLDGAPLEDVAITDETITFKLGAPANAVFSGKFLDDQRNKVEGTIAQAGAEFPFTMERMAPGEKTGPARPQMPEPPFPYETRDVTFENIEAGVTLAGTLSIPEGEGPHPAVIFITGSGPQDRDETLLGHKPFLVIADHLARNGVASLRYDDRGFGESSGDFATATTLSFVADARAALAYLETVPEIDPDRRGIIGHSEGGLAAPFVARNNDDVDFIVLLAGTALPGFDIVLTQSALIQRASGVPEETVELAAAQQREVFEFILQSDLRGEELREALIAKIEGMIGDQMPDETERRTIAETQARQVGSPWFIEFLTLDPRPALREVEVPVLALNGELDLQVPPDPNLYEIEKALRAANNNDVTILELEGLNHLFQPTQTGLPTEYRAIETTIDPTVLDIITRWLRDRANVN